MKRAFSYIIFILVGGIITYNTVSLPRTLEDKPVVDVNVHVPKPVLIHDTIIKPEVKSKYVYKNKCCCSPCSNDSVK